MFRQINFFTLGESKQRSTLVALQPAASADGAKDVGPSAVSKSERLAVAGNFGDT